MEGTTGNIRDKFMSSILLTAPAVEPLTLVEAKAFLRVESNDDDDVIAALIAAARVHVESDTRRALITQSWRLSFDAWPEDGRVPVLPAPLQSLSAARVYDSENVAHAIDTATFVLDKSGSELIFSPWALPAPGRVTAGIEIDVTVGYGVRRATCRSRCGRLSASSPRIGTRTAASPQSVTRWRCCLRPSPR